MRPASTRRPARAATWSCCARLRQAYPDAETDIRLAFAADVPPPTRVIVDHEEDVAAAGEIDALAAALRVSGEWAVSAS